MSRATEASLAALHGAVAAELTRRILDAEATAADIGAAIKFLKDNSITASIEDNAALAELKQKLDQRLAKRDAQTLPVRAVLPTAEDIGDVLDGIALGSDVPVP